MSKPQLAVPARLKARLVVRQILATQALLEETLDGAVGPIDPETERVIASSNEELREQAEELKRLASELPNDDPWRVPFRRLACAYDTWMSIELDANPAFVPFLNVVLSEYEEASRAARKMISEREPS